MVNPNVVLSTHGLDAGQEIRGKMAIIFASIGNEDQTEARGRNIDFSYHTTRAGAQIGARGLGYSGPDGKVEERVVLRLENGHYYFINPLQPLKVSDDEEDAKVAAELRESALNKLSPSERVALGFPLK